MKVLILTEGSKNIGFGHITRCTSLYQAFVEKGISPVFIINGDETVRNLLTDMNYEIFNWLIKEERLFDFLKDTDVTVIDSYLADYKLYTKVSDTVKLSIYIDDNKRIDYPEGIVVNGTIYAEEMDYPVKKDVTYLLGSKYIPIRKEFWHVPEKKINENINSILITFGGDDARNMTPKVLTLMTKGYPSVTKNVVIGKGFENIEEIKSASDGNIRLIYYPHAEGMKNIMCESDIAISSSGQTLYELARVGVPAIAIAAADNQMNNVRGWKKAGFIEYAGWWEDKEILNSIVQKLKLLEDRNLRQKKALTGRTMVDGKGTERIIEQILNRCWD